MELELKSLWCTNTFENLNYICKYVFGQRMNHKGNNKILKTEQFNCNASKFVGYS